MIAWMQDAWKETRGRSRALIRSTGARSGGDCGFFSLVLTQAYPVANQDIAYCGDSGN
jgi:hypothetical protein